MLPPEIAKLVSLKVLAVQKNRIQQLPLCLGDMVSLAILKLDGNKLNFPPREVLQVQASSPPNEGFLKESEVTEVTVTAHIKRFLKQKSLERAGATRASDRDNGTDDGSEGNEGNRALLRRVASGRFPIRVNGMDAPDIRSPNLPRPPPIPSRSHARGLSQQNTSIRKPGVMPLTIGNPNERVRSNSETLLPGSRLDRTPGERPRRIMSKRANELGTLDETQANNRFSHYRGLSHGSSMTGNAPNMGAVISPNSPAEPLLQRPNYVRRLSVLPEQRRESKTVDPIVEAAKGILYAIFQVHPMIQLFTRLTNDGTAKRSSLEIVFFNTNVHVEELEQEIMKHESAEGSDPRENENVQRAVMTLIHAYGHICSILLNNMDTIVSNGDPRYIRTLMLCIYNSITELRVTASETLLGMPGGAPPAPSTRRLGPGGTIKPHSRDSSTTPTSDRRGHGPPRTTRARNGSINHNPSNLRVATDVPMPYINGGGRTATITSATPRSGESFNSDGSRFAPDIPSDERHFEKIFLALSKSSDILMRTLPNLNTHFSYCLRDARSARAPEHILHCWKALIGRCGHAIHQTDMLKGRLSVIKFKEPGIRTDPGFWALCKNFVDAWAEFGSMLKRSMDHIALPMDIRAQLRPVQLSVKETTQLIFASPWAGIFRNPGQVPDGSHYYSPGHYASSSTATQPPLPVTPQSAALGPAVQATVPSTPQSASFANAFSGNVFERADALISMGGLSMSRSGTMSSMSHGSISSIASMSSAPDDRLGPNDMGGPGPYRRNGGGKFPY